MTGGDVGYLFYLILLGTFVAGYFVWDRRQSFSTTVQQALIWVFIFALATPIGALISMNVMDHLNPDPIGFALGISAGTFLYISVGDLLPTVHEEDEKKNLNLVLLFVGILVMFLSTGLE